jgi:hypothetical protein
MGRTPLDKYKADVYKLADHTPSVPPTAETGGVDYSKKKNRLMFLKDETLLKLPGIREQSRNAASVLR